MARDPVCGMKVDEKTGLKFVFKDKVLYFCSRHCLEKFASEHGLSPGPADSCAVFLNRPFYLNKSFIISAVLVFLILLSLFFNFLIPFRNSLLIYVRTIWWAIVLGLFLGGLIDYYVPGEYVSFLLSAPGKKTIIKAVFLGFLMSACSHGILALAIQLHKKGASNPAVAAFLLATPWANLTLTIMLVGFFKVYGIYFILAAVIIALNTGFIFQFLEKRSLIESNKNTLSLRPGFSLLEDIKERRKNYRLSYQQLTSDIKGIFQGMLSLADMVLWWVLIGIGLASLAGAYVPGEIFSSYMGPTLGGLLVTLAAATVIEVCSEGSAPMAFELFRQTKAVGNSFVFLMAGVVTDYTEIGLLWHNLGKKTALAFTLVSVPQVIISGFFFNLLFSF